MADFGVSAPLESTRSAGIGLARTIAFWPPESATQGVLQADGVRRPPVEGWRASQLGDVWALAVSAHRMLTGRHITAGTTPEQQYELVCLGRYAIDRRLGRRLAAAAGGLPGPGPAAAPGDDAGPVPAAGWRSWRCRRRTRACRGRPGRRGWPRWSTSTRRPAGRCSRCRSTGPAAGCPASWCRPTASSRPPSCTSPRTCCPRSPPARRPGLPRPTAPPTPPWPPNGASPALNGATRAPSAHEWRGPCALGPQRCRLPLATARRRRHNGAAAATAPGDPAATQIVTLAELERTRQHRPRSPRSATASPPSGDEVAADRDRLRREHAELARRLDRLEREAGLRRPPVAERERTAILAPVRREPTLTMAPVRREPTKAYEPPAAPAVPQARPSTSDKPSAPSTSDPKPSASRPRAAKLARRLGRMLRRLVMLVVVLGILAVLALVGISALFNTTPGQGDEPGRRHPRPGPRRGLMTAPPPGLVRARLLCPGRRQVPLGPGESVSFGRSAPAAGRRPHRQRQPAGEPPGRHPRRHAVRRAAHQHRLEPAVRRRGRRSGTRSARARPT